MSTFEEDLKAEMAARGIIAEVTRDADGDVVLSVSAAHPDCPHCYGNERAQIDDDGMHDEKCNRCGWYFQKGAR